MKEKDKHVPLDFNKEKQACGGDREGMHMWHAVFHTSLYKGLEQPRILVSVGVLQPIPPEDTEGQLCVYVCWC